MPAEPIAVIAPTCVRMSFGGTLGGGKKWATVADISVDAGTESRLDVIQDAVNNITGLFQDHVLLKLGNSVAFTGAVWLDVDSLDGQSGFVTPRPSKPTAGGDGNPQGPPNVSYLIRKSCTHNRRQRTGRMYLPGVTENASTDDGVVDGGRRTAITAEMESFRTGIIALSTVAPLTTIAWRVIHIKEFSGTPEPGWPRGRPTAWESSDVDSATCDNRVATQRRRLR